VCGLLYAHRTPVSEPPLEALAAPVCSEPRYAGRAVYFGDLVVASDSPIASFADLRGKAFAYNDPGSFSGFACVRAHLDSRGERAGYFGRTVVSGSHQGSLRFVLDGKADVASIDSLVLASELARDPLLTKRVRTIASIGPNPAPPVVASIEIDDDTRETLRAELLALHETSTMTTALARHRLARYAAVSRSDYEDILRKSQRAEAIPLATNEARAS
jgi:phosphonate transport system substrate-binding protein